MITQLKNLSRSYFIIVLAIALVTFAWLNYIQQKDRIIIHWGTINPEASLDQVLEHINNQHQKPISQNFDNVESKPSQPLEILDLEEMMSDLIWWSQDTHQAADMDYNTKLTQLCIIYDSSCELTLMDGNYTAKQIFAYQLMIVYMVNKLEGYGYDPLTTLQNITINNYTKWKRWYANAKILVINTYQIVNYKEFLQVLAHEMWHVLDLWAISGTSSVINPDYTEFGKAKFAVDDQSLAFYALSWSNEDTLRSRMTNQDFVSGYGMSNPFEDFAECHNMYLYHRDVFAYMAQDSTTLKQKYDYFNTLYKTRKLSANFDPTDMTTLEIDFRPWDSTRM